jgi:hypothetical protein
MNSSDRLIQLFEVFQLVKLFFGFRASNMFQHQALCPVVSLESCNAQRAHGRFHD